MIALTMMPIAPRVARAEGPIIDADVQRLMDEKPDEEHPLIVSVELCRTPLDIAELLPAPEETNECTRLWVAWELLAEQFKEGCDESITQEMVDAAYVEAKTYDEVIASFQQAAHQAYHEDYAQIVGESVPDVYESLRSVLGDKVRRVGEGSKLICLRADQGEFEQLRQLTGIKRISLDLAMSPMIDWSRRNIGADDVHCSITNSPYTGYGVSVAVVDTGVQYGYEYEQQEYSHPRLKEPTATKNFVCLDGRGTGDFCSRVGHGTLVAGVIFCQPDDEAEGGPCDEEEGIHVGIAYEADMVVAKILDDGPYDACDPGGCSIPCECDTPQTESWALSVEAFEWSVSDPSPAPQADLITCSVVALGYLSHEYTEADSLPSLNVDWVVSSSGSSFVQACGNSGESGILAPSGAYNCIAVGAYNDKNADNRSANEMWSSSSWGPTVDNRRKPDLCAPGVNIVTTRHCWMDDCGVFNEVNGTSFATPHVAGVCALIKEARPSLTPAQMHAILVNSADFMDTENQQDWAEQPGWGMLNAQKAVQYRNYIADGTVEDPDDVVTIDLTTIPAGQEVVVSGVWNRAMSDEDSPVEDGELNPAPANLDLILEKKASGGSWEEADTTSGTYAGHDEQPEDNVRQVRAFQSSTGQPQLLFRVKVKHNPTADTPYEGPQAFSLASRHAFD